MNQFQGEDLIVMNIDKVKSEGRVSIRNQRINRFRDSLRQSGILSDLGQREFETLKYRYPNNIEIEDSAIIIVASDAFVNAFERKTIEMTGRLKNAAIIWKTVK